MGGNGKNIILRQKQLTNAVPISKCLSEGGEKILISMQKSVSNLVHSKKMKCFTSVKVLAAWL